MTTVEKKLEKRFTQDVKRLKGYCIKLLPDLETGLPDREYMLPGGVHGYVEFKSSAREANYGLLEGKQAIWRNRLIRLGHTHWVVYDEKTYLCLLKSLTR